VPASRVFAELLAVVAPPACATCSLPLVRAPDVLCGDCLRALPWLRGARCPRCALPAGHGGRRGCPAAGAAFTLAWAPLAYDGPARAAVVALKFRGALPLAEVMAAQIAASAPPGLFARDAALVPVPLPAARRRRRGFDQAARLAAALGRRIGLPVAACLRRRDGGAARQMGASRAARRAAGRLDLVACGEVPRSAVLVDDVHTTGATFDACARALRAAGAQRVVAVSYARTL